MVGCTLKRRFRPHACTLSCYGWPCPPITLPAR